MTLFPNKVTSWGTEGLGLQYIFEEDTIQPVKQVHRLPRIKCSKPGPYLYILKFAEAFTSWANLMHPHETSSENGILI